VRELRLWNEILKGGVGFFATERDGRPKKSRSSTSTARCLGSSRSAVTPDHPGKPRDSKLPWAVASILSAGCGCRSSISRA
jgi:hypothetical protein